MPKIELIRANGEFGFEASDENGHILKMDTSPQTGGQDYGFRPMQVLLAALAGCSGIDVIHILKKQRQTVRDYKTIVDGEREVGKDSSLWKEITLHFHIYGDVDPDKAEKAVALSVGKYCSVAETLIKAGAVIKYETTVHP